MMLSPRETATIAVLIVATIATAVCSAYVVSSLLGPDVIGDIDLLMRAASQAATNVLLLLILMAVLRIDRRYGGRHGDGKR